MVSFGPFISPAQALADATEAARQQAAQRERQRRQERIEEIRRARERQIEGIGVRPAARGAAALPRPGQPVVTPQQIGQRPTARVVDLRQETPDEGAFRELVKGYVSGELDVDVLAETGRPAASVVTLSPARTQKFFESQAADEADIRELERLTAALERGMRSKPVDERVEIQTPIPGQGVSIRLSGRQREILGAVRDAALGRPVREISAQAESDLRDQISDILQRRMPRQEYLEMLADLGWDDQFQKRFLQDRTLAQALLTQPQTDTGEFIFQDKALETYFRRQQARREELAAFGLEAGAVPLFSVNLPLKATIQALKQAPRASRQRFVSTLTRIIKEERGSIGIARNIPQEQIQLIKRGRGRVAATEAPKVSAPSVGVQERTLPQTRPNIPGKFDPDTFDPFRPFAPDVPDDPLRVVRRQRRLTRTIEVPQPQRAIPTPERVTPRRIPAPGTPVRVTPSRITRPGIEQGPEAFPGLGSEEIEIAQPGRETLPAARAATLPAQQPEAAPAPAPQPSPGPAPEPETPAIRPPTRTPARPATERPPGRPAPPRTARRASDEPTEPSERLRMPVTRNGLFASVVGWRQGAFFKTLNLVTGEERTLSEPPPGLREGITPEQTFTILEFSPNRPRKQSFRMGIVTVDVNTRSIGFERSRTITDTPAIPQSRRVTQKGLDRGRI